MFGKKNKIRIKNRGVKTGESSERNAKDWGEEDFNGFNKMQIRSPWI